ncbi:2-amino-4-hydroxy-6-hydroxymethyldihydropteridine diphosphokinase [Anaerobaca lacustris]|uniref:2-amino-4-hydroxy-6-hydroxymethyldihydropteridine pyrophosphokinase n=1 Tax=Anaerobaca lacustris TaxID=3044600 RepID=A0AAW6TYI6_9BACT|nr:2-amino-4-hydroxy-6-hydroxymethyldihydropteridine diphosphokinase [Sedimentisphaerales bacterium M17dextr]
MAERIAAYIGLGSNLGDRRRTIREALAALDRHPDIKVARVSDIKETAPLGQASEPYYLNGVAEVHTTLAPEGLLSVLMATEDVLGRTRRGRWGPRTIDLDLLLFGGQIVRLPHLIVPHPQMHLRSFVLDGLCQLDGQIVHPLFHEPVCELARRLGGGSFALDPAGPQLVSVAGPIGVGKTTLVKRLAAALDGQVLLEPYDTNPFLARVYAGQKDLALDSQLYFLLHRADQLRPEALSQESVSLTDYVFQKELIYARRLLDAEQLELYERVYEVFARTVKAPALVIYLTDSPERCLERIHRRNRPYEQQIALDFLEALHQDYERLSEGWRTCPLIRLFASNVGIDDEAAIEHVALQVKAYVAEREHVTVA